MKKFTMLFFCLISFIYSDPLQDYYDLIEKHPKLTKEIGNFRKGEIEIMLDPMKIQMVESFQRKRLLGAGHSNIFAEKASTVGLVFEDPYWLLIRDAVVFPSGHMGTYNRLVLKSSLQGGSEAGVAVLPELEDGRVILILTYRHATRSWELEIPRGLQKKGESMFDAAKRETYEETGCAIDQLLFLGKIAVDSGLVESKIPVFSAKVQKMEESKTESSEAILSNVILTKKEVEEGLLKGEIEIRIKNKKRLVSMKDGFLSYAVLQKILQKKW